MDTCIEHVGTLDRLGYGRVYVSGKRISAHRVAWEEKYGKIPNGLFVCHRCDNPRCVNTNHLFLGTQSDNVRDSVIKRRHRNSKKTHCPRGHEYSVENTFRRKDGKRNCKLCDRIRCLARDD